MISFVKHVVLITRDYKKNEKMREICSSPINPRFKAPEIIKFRPYVWGAKVT